MGKENKYSDQDALVVVDVQNDFVNGALGSDAAQAILPGVVEMVKDFPGFVLATKDTHTWDYEQTLEGHKLPVIHCVKNTAGWAFPMALDEALSRRQYKTEILEKFTFGNKDIGAALCSIAGWSGHAKSRTIYICGLCTDICVISNALILRATFPNTRMVCLQELCAGTSKEAHDAALTVMRSCQIDVE